VKLPMLIVLVLAACLAGGCAGWDANDRRNDFQCGYAVSSEGPDGAIADRQNPSMCGADYAAAAVAYENIREGRRHELGHD